MSSNSQRTSKDKPRSVKCRHFCLHFDSHNYCPSCREANKGDDPCVTLKSPCEICASSSDEQINKIKNRKRYIRKQKADTSRDNELDLLGDEDVDSFTGSQADFEGAAEQLFASPPRPQPLVSSHCLLKLQPNLSHLPLVLPYSRKSNPNLKNPWVLTLTSNYNNKWVYSRLLSLRQ